MGRSCRRLLRRFGLPADLDLLAGGFQPFGADLQVDARLIDGFQRVFEGKVAVLQQLQLLVELLERLFVGELLAHGSTSSTLAPRRPDASRMRTRRLILVAAAERMTVPDSASSVML